MPTTTAKSVDPALWWDPFTSLLADLENAPLAADLAPPLAKKLKDNRSWFVETVSRFKGPNAKSREALSSDKLAIGPHELTVKPELRDKALHISSYLCLDEVQSYIVVERSLERCGLAVDSVPEEYLHVVLIHYYIERQCLLKCTRRILMHALYVGITDNDANAVKDETLKLISDGLESKLISVLQDLLSTSHPGNMDADLFTLWAEETLTEDNLVLDILFLIYYESLCACNGETWRRLCSLYKGVLSGAYNLGNLEVSTEALKSAHHTKVQLLLVLIEALDLENLFQLVHDAVPFRQGSSYFPVEEIQQMDVLVSTFEVFEMKGAAPLILAWAVFLCLLSSLPEKEENNVLMDIDHSGYARQAIEGASLSYCLMILDSDMLQESDGLVAGYRSVLRTFISAFIASYEINVQSDDDTVNLILDILCKIYRGEESLCVQFWDKESFIDGPIRCFLCALEEEFPIRISELVRLLSCLCEGSWPAECVYNFLDKSVGVTTSFEVSNVILVDNTCQIIETQERLLVPGFENLYIPGKSRGQVLKLIDGNVALVRWENTPSGLIVLLLRLAQTRCLDANEKVLILDLLTRMVSFNTAVTFSLMEIGNLLNFDTDLVYGQLEKRFWAVEVICAIVKNLHPNAVAATVMSLAVSMLSVMLRCAPSHIASICLKANIFETPTRTSIFDVGNDVSTSSSGSWMLSGRLAKMLLIDSEDNNNDHPLAISVLEFTMQLVEKKLEDDHVLELVAFVMQYVLVNHEFWRYKMKHVRWKITLKVLKVMKKCIVSIPFYGKFGPVIRDLLLTDSSIHNALFRLTCVNKEILEKLYVSRLVELVEIEGLEHAIASALDVCHLLLSDFPEETSSTLPVFHQVVLSSATKPIPFTTVMVSLVSYFRNPAMQVGAARVLSKLFGVVDYLKPSSSGNMFFGLDDDQIADLRQAVHRMLLERMESTEDLFIAVLNMLVSAARYQPAFLLAVVSPKDGADLRADSGRNSNDSSKSSLLDGLIKVVERAPDLITSNPRVLLPVLEFLRALWQGAAHYMNFLEYLKGSGNLWKQLSSCVSSLANLKDPILENPNEEANGFEYKFQCQSAILEIMACDIFLEKKLQNSVSLEGVADNATTNEKLKSKVDGVRKILSSWSEKSVLLSILESYASVGYDYEMHYRVKVAASLLIVHVMEKLSLGNSGSLAFSLLQKIHTTFEKMSAQPAFSELLGQYARRGYSTGKQLECLILNDLYYHLRGEIEGREMGLGPFKELSQFLIESDCMRPYKHKTRQDFPDFDAVYCYDLAHIRSDLGLDMWDYTEWKESKTIAQSMLDFMQEVNSWFLLATSKLCSLRALTTLLAVYEDEGRMQCNGQAFHELEKKLNPLGRFNCLDLHDSQERKAKTGSKMPSKLSLSCINHLCQHFHNLVVSLDPVPDASCEILNFLAAQAELLFHLVRSVGSCLSVSAALCVLRTSGSGLKMLLEPSLMGVGETRKLLLALLLLTMEFMESSDMDFNVVAEVSNFCLGFLPVLCNCIGTTEHYTLSLAATDLILTSFLAPTTWFPVVSKHLQWQHIVLKLQDQVSLASVRITLKFLLTLTRVKDVAEMLLNAGLFRSLIALLANLTGDTSSSLPAHEGGFLKSSDRTETSQHIWGLSLAVITAVVHSLGENSLNRDILDNVVFYLFSEKAHLISYHLSAPDFPSDDHDKKRLRAQRTQMSLTALTEMEQTLTLMCALAKHRRSWAKAMKEMDAQLREKSVHLLAFISRGSHRVGESLSKSAPILCSSAVNGELDSCEKPSFVKSRNGWFALSPYCCQSKSRAASFSTSSTALTIRDQSTESAQAFSPTYVSDMVGLQIYRIAFLLLKFLSLEAENAAKVSEEVGFVDLGHVPELPMPEILHGLQDQAVAIVAELCHSDKSRMADAQIQSVCLLLVQVMEMSLYLEFYVIQICGIRPVLGRLEDFSKEAKLLLKAMEGHAFLNPSSRSLKQIISLVYPGLLQSEGFL